MVNDERSNLKMKSKLTGANIKIIMLWYLNGGDVRQVWGLVERKAHCFLFLYHATRDIGSHENASSIPIEERETLLTLCHKIKSDLA